MAGNLLLTIAAFGGVTSVVISFFRLIGSHARQIDTRLAEIARRAPEGSDTLSKASSVLTNLGARIMPEHDEKVEQVHARLLQAGFYRQYASAIFYAARFLLLVVPIVVGLCLAVTEALSLTQGILCGIFVGVLGTVVPGIWIAERKAARQRSIRRALPDTLDVIVICLEGGLSVPAAFARVAEELGTAYPLLASEMNIVRKQIELGQSTSAAFREFSDRFGVDELRSLAVLIGQAEKYGASLVRTMRIEADALRMKRYQWAEGQAQKAPLKLIFPTVLCIFPALYIILMGPAGLQLYQMLKNMGP